MTVLSTTSETSVYCTYMFNIALNIVIFKIHIVAAIARIMTASGDNIAAINMPQRDKKSLKL